MTKKRKKTLCLIISVILFAGLLYVFSGAIMTSIGKFLVVDDEPVRSDAVVVLNTGLELYPRLMEAAMIYRQGFASTVVINGNRKSTALRELEKKGFRPCCPWYEDHIGILALLGVPRGDVKTISAADAYNTVSEAGAVGKALSETGVTRIIITTSKYHSRRARFIWKRLFKNQFRITMVAARSDPYSPQGWWKEGRQIRWVLAEYGAWIYYFWKTKGLIS